jgi:low affinity Fe/Cu permease
MPRATRPTPRKKKPRKESPIERISLTSVEQGKLSENLEGLAAKVTGWAGGNWGFGLAALAVVVWAACGPFFQYSQNWQLVINTGTTIITFLMVFLIQRSQNKESRAVQLKLNELVAAVEGASNRLIDVENLSENELETLRGHYQTLAELAQACENITESHSVEEATSRHQRKFPPKPPAADQKTA